MLEIIKNKLKNSASFYLKALIIAILIFLFRQQAKSQVQQVLQAIKPEKKFEGTPVLAKKSHVLQLTVGAPNNVASLISLQPLFGALNTSSNSGKKSTGPIAINYEYFLQDELGIGIGVSYARASQIYNYPIINLNQYAELSALTISGNLFYHIYTTDKLDAYTKASAGFNIWKGYQSNVDGSNKTDISLPTPFAYNGQVGLRYFFNPKIAAIGELGYSNLKFTANAGIAFKLQ